MSDRVWGIITIVISLCLFTSVTLIKDRDLIFFSKIRLSKDAHEHEISEILKTINLYNKIFTDFYASDGGTAMLDEFPGVTMLRHHTFRDIGFLRLHNLVLVYDMAEMLPVKIEISSPKTAEAIILERWNYVYQERGSRELLSRVKGMGKGFKYYLLRAGDHWIIQDYEPVDIEEPEIKEFRF